jgi:hypothetical protein
LPTAINETRRHAAIQAGKIDVIELHLDDTQRQLGMEDKACMEIRFHLDAFVGGGVGVTIEVVDTRSDVSRPESKHCCCVPTMFGATLAGPRAAKHLITGRGPPRIAGERWDLDHEILRKPARVDEDSLWRQAARSAHNRKSPARLEALAPAAS